MSHDLPMVLQFSRGQTVQLKTTEDGTTEIHVTPKIPKKPHYRTRYTLPFVSLDSERWRWFYATPGSNDQERQARAKYYWEEFVTYVRGPHKRRRSDSIELTVDIIRHLFVWEELNEESRFFSQHLAEALIAHLRVGLDEAKTDAALAVEAVA